MVIIPSAEAMSKIETPGRYFCSEKNRTYTITAPNPSLKNLATDGSVSSFSQGASSWASWNVGNLTNGLYDTAAYSLGAGDSYNVNRGVTVTFTTPRSPSYFLIFGYILPTWKGAVEFYNGSSWIRVKEFFFKEDISDSVLSTGTIVKFNENKQIVSNQWRWIIISAPNPPVTNYYLNEFQIYEYY